MIFFWSLTLITWTAVLTTPAVHMAVTLPANAVAQLTSVTPDIASLTAARVCLA